MIQTAKEVERARHGCVSIISYDILSKVAEQLKAMNLKVRAG